MNFFIKRLFSHRVEDVATRQRYRHAALAYMVYGLIYMAGAGHLGLTGASARAAERGAWVWYVVGAAIVIIVPWLLTRGYVWFTRVLTLLLLVRMVGLMRLATGPTAQDPLPLVGGATVSTGTGAIAFAVVAAVAASFLARASFRRQAAG